MGNWSTNGVVLEPIEFDGDSITFTVKRLLVEDMLVLSKYFSKETGALSFGSPLEVCQTAQEIFPKYIQDVRGLLKADNVAMTPEEFLGASKDFYFVPLVGQLFTALITASTVKAVEAKNSEPPSVALSVV